jgi:hypothetical protein
MLRAWGCGAVAQAVTASVLLQPMSRDRVTILGQVCTAVILATLFAPPMLVALWLVDLIPSWWGRAPLLAFAVVAELIGYVFLALSLPPSGPGSETWFAFFGETAFLEQLGPILVSELALLAVALPFWPWVSRKHSAQAPPT